MFTGIVETMGTVRSIVPMDSTTSGGGGFSITIGDAEIVLEDVHLGDSIAVEGCCLTVTEFDEARTQFKVGVSPETLRKTSLGDFQVGSKVNLERAMSSTTRVGGHLVQGHVDLPIIIHAITPDPPNSLLLTFHVPQVSGDIDYLRYIIPKGYVTLDGASLTVVSVDTAQRLFSVMLIAYTQEKIVLARKKVGAKVNLEVDQVGKYVEKVAVAMLSGEGGGTSVIAEMIKKMVDERVKEVLAGAK
ncbi:Riboflavin synthase alpha chain [Geranomyces variabilis]|nr:Riboflavin synthase alpha chain [Geranomyces variabilis]